MSLTAYVVKKCRHATFSLSIPHVKKHSYVLATETNNLALFMKANQIYVPAATNWLINSEVGS
jgi:hypothetical protein